MRTFRKVAGFSLLNIVLSVVIVAGAFVAFNRGLMSLENRTLRARQSLVAETQAMELLELFRSFSTAHLKDYLSTNPVSASFGAYPLCSGINLIDRGSGNILNEDPIATLPSSNLPTHESSALHPNRFYQIQVVDAVTLAVNKDACAETAATVTLGADDRFMISVGVSWVPNGKKPEEVRRVVMSTLLPDAL